MEKLRIAKHFSIMIDGATDGGTIENEAVYIRFMADEVPVNAFLSIQAVKQGNASGILDAIYAGNVEWLDGRFTVHKCFHLKCHYDIEMQKAIDK